MSHILHLDLTGFFVAVERRHDPRLVAKPIVIGGQPTGWGRVVAASREAARRGIKPGMSLSVAASRCPDAIFLDGSVDRYLDASAAIDELVRAPGLPLEWVSVDSVFLDVSTCAGGSRTLAERIQDGIRRLGFDCACGLAGGKVTAQIASRLSRPNGVLFVLPGYEGRLLAPLPVTLLPELLPAALRRLRDAGVVTMGALAALEPDRARELLGIRGPILVERAGGGDSRPVGGSRLARSDVPDVPHEPGTPATLQKAQDAIPLVGPLVAPLFAAGGVPLRLTDLLTDDGPIPPAPILPARRRKSAPPRHRGATPPRDRRTA